MASPWEIFSSRFFWLSTISYHFCKADDIIQNGRHNFAAFNSFDPGKCGCNIRLSILKRIASMNIFIISFEIFLKWMPQSRPQRWLANICSSNGSVCRQATNMTQWVNWNVIKILDVSFEPLQRTLIVISCKLKTGYHDMHTYGMYLLRIAYAQICIYW